MDRVHQPERDSLPLWEALSRFGYQFRFFGKNKNGW
jgi:hypothetical protein